MVSDMASKVAQNGVDIFKHLFVVGLMKPQFNKNIIQNWMTANKTCL